MRIRKANDLKWSDVTPKALYVNRRQFLAVAPFMAAAAAEALSPDEARAQGGLPKLDAKKSPLSTTEPMTPYKSVTTYNNYYEFGIDKGDPAEYAKSLKTRPWTVTIDGAVNSRREVRDRRSDQAVSARGADLPAPLRRGVVDRDALDRLPARRPAQEGPADREGEVRRVHDAE